MLDSLAALPLVFPAIVLGLAFLEMFVHAGTRIYGSLLSLVIVSVVAYMPVRACAMRSSGSSKFIPNLRRPPPLPAPGTWELSSASCLPLLVPAMISCWLFVFLLAVRAVSLMLLLVGPDSQVVAVALFDFWNNGQIGELAALGCVWTAIMTVFSVAFLIVARRYQLPDRHDRMPSESRHVLHVENLTKVYSPGESGGGIRNIGVRCRGRRVLHAAWSVGLRKDNHLAVLSPALRSRQPGG